eukprot:TRINITY_DN9985_c0_g2_i2.p1 TRINITY_DN9985_c0_g2~~TRINITY_DN9985_c0_g2_i2.p1  ORF type:complete len:383 (+),score=132.58 TRINITY_DN9985_c0_g2_i2:224-1372(+)
MASQSSDDGIAPDHYMHGMRHQKHILRHVTEESFGVVIKGEETPWTGDADREKQTICFIHLTHGCECRAAWRVVPRHLLNVVGGKVSMAKLFRTYRLTRLCPTTYISLQEFLKAKEAESAAAGDASEKPVKWFVKVSHANSRKGMLCATAAEDIMTHVTSFPTRFRYVIQQEVPNPLLRDGYKLLLRLWVLLVVNPDGSVGVHFSRRLRVNRLQSKYDEEEASARGDLCHHPANIFDDSQTWDKYGVYWSSCVATADLIIRTMLHRWRASMRQQPLSMHKQGGLFNIFAMDYIPNTSNEAVLIETNVDPGFKNRCSETRLAARDFTDFFFVPIMRDGCPAVPDKNFRSVTIDADEALGSTAVTTSDSECSADEDEDEDEGGD